ncbi:EVE domain-containing protein [Mycetocola zhujimingii]|uniref:UPF0310 protein DF223_09865 n=1 Tax=Mycetocola zhujimingii TaxID=2079792 RepID=A0A2U1TDA1_9MICO|nr:EVE domain-containing protein [Mycetocola zhujimingii]PWC06753.1 EVE domain-containing protein [Mycetocola zhujimingii]
MAIRYWLAVASRDHVHNAVDLGIAQVNHGQRGGLDAMGEADGIVWYSPKTEHPDGEPLREFMAIGRIASGMPYQAISLDRRPWRRRVDYERDAEPAPIRPMLGMLDFTRDQPQWGYQLRRGLLEISRYDFHLIREAMQRPSADDRRYPEHRR